MKLCPNCNHPMDSGRAVYCSRRCQVQALHRKQTGVVRLPDDLHARLKAASEERDLSMTVMVNKAVTQFLDRLIPVDEIRRTRSKENA